MHTAWCKFTNRVVMRRTAVTKLQAKRVLNVYSKCFYWSWVYNMRGQLILFRNCEIFREQFSAILESCPSTGGHQVPGFVNLQSLLRGLMYLRAIVICYKLSGKALNPFHFSHARFCVCCFCRREALSDGHHTQAPFSGILISPFPRESMREWNRRVCRKVMPTYLCL